MSLSPYVMFNGQCEEAFAYYVQHLGGTLETLMHYSDAPPGQPSWDDMDAKVMHARVSFRGQVLMGSDSPPARFTPMQGAFVSLDAPNAAEAERMFAAICDGGSVTMPMQETFWAERFGMATDKFGIAWMIDSPKPG